MRTLRVSVDGPLRSARPVCSASVGSVQGREVVAETLNERNPPMTNDTNSLAKTPNKPAYYAYVVRERETDEKKSNMWLIRGAAWPHKDGRGMNLELESVPINGRTVRRDATEKRK